MKIILLCNRPVKNADASTITDHLDAFVKYSRHEVYTLSFKRDLPRHLDLARFDVIIVHYSIAIGYHSEHYISENTKGRIRDCRGLKIVFIQDEYREINKVHDALVFMGVDVLFTCIPEREIEKVYPQDKLPGLTKINNLTGYVPERLLEIPSPPIANRPIDIGYRSRKLPFWLGQLAFEKWQIVDRIKEKTKGSKLILDVSYDEADRIYGKNWISYLTSCKTMLGVESGASVFDFNGDLQSTVEKYQDEFPSASFSEVQQKFLVPYEGKIYLNQISPRCFESAALKTVMLLYEGNYSGILVPWRHYIPLKKDFSNFHEVMDVLRDSDRMQAIADTAYSEIACNEMFSYKYFIRKFDKIIDVQFSSQKRGLTINPYTMSGYKVHLFLSHKYMFRRFASLVSHKILLGTFMRKYVFRLWGRLPSSLQDGIRPLLRLIGH